MSNQAVSAPRRRFDRYTMLTLYTVLPAAPLTAALVLSDASDWTWATLPHLLALTAAAALGLPTVRATMRRAHEHTPWPGALLAAFLVVTATAAVLGALAALPGDWAGMDIPTLLFLIPLVLACVVVSPPLSWRAAVLPAVVAAVLTTGAWILLHGGFNSEGFAAGRWFPVLFASLVITLGLAWSTTLTVWMQRQMAEQAELTEVRSDLAVAEERLRFSRDLHDIFGRTLTAVTVKADLAAELSDLGRSEQASVQMREVHRLAEDALREVRAVVGGYRAIDLDAELRGARALLGAAGIRTRIIGDGAGLPQSVAEALAWTVREGATNIVHHSSASESTISLTHGSDAAVLAITNDGALASDDSPAVPGGRAGSGLEGIRDRLDPLGGTLTTSTGRGRFTLTARIPLEAL